MFIWTFQFRSIHKAFLPNDNNIHTFQIFTAIPNATEFFEYLQMS